MFHIITPSSGDRILIGCFMTALPYRFNPSLLIPVKPKSCSMGFRPHTFERDRFGNSNCDHLNVKGTVISYDFPGASLGGRLSYYPDVTMSSTAYLPRWIKIGDFPETDTLIRPGQEYHRKLPGIYTQLSRNKYVEYSEMKISWVTDYRAVLVFTRRNENAVTGVETSYRRKVSYIEFTFGYTKRRSHSLEVGRNPYAKWIMPSDVVFSVFRNVFTVSGNSSRFPFQLLDIYQRLKRPVKEFASSDSSSFGMLTVDTAQRLKVLDLQLGLFLADFTRLFDTVRAFVGVANKLTLKSASTAYLSYHYGLKLTYLDTKEFVGAFRRTVGLTRDGYTVARGRLSQSGLTTINGKSFKVDHQYNMMIYCRVYPNEILSVVNKFMVADFFPTTELVWDMIPFSFVADWFLRIGDVFEAIDSNTLLSTYEIASVVYSRRSEVTVSVTELFPILEGKFTGDLTVVDYHRHVSKTCPPYQPLSGIVPTQPFNHWVEGAALIVQRMR